MESARVCHPVVGMGPRQSMHCNDENQLGFHMQTNEIGGSELMSASEHCRGLTKAEGH